MSGRRTCCGKAMFQKCSRTELQMKREALQKINRKANENRTGFDMEKVN